MNKAAGYNLIEFLIAQLLAMIIFASMLMSYLSMVNPNQLQQVLQELTASTQFSAEILSERIRLAGYAGCADSNHPIDQNQAITGYDSAHAPAEFHETIAPDTDAVVINGCVSNKGFSEDLTLTKMMYFIADTNRKNSVGEKIFSLFQKPVNGDRIELVAGVEKMKLNYGLVSQGTSTVYFPASQVVDWNQVKSISMDLLFNSIEPALRSPQSYYFQSQKISAKDLLWRQPWNVDINLRERLYGT